MSKGFGPKPILRHNLTDDKLAKARDTLASAERIVVFTGAGISTDSGIPDYRGPDGVWTKNPAAEANSTIGNYIANRDIRIRAWSGGLNRFGADATPNVGHHKVAALEATGRVSLVVTQNVDGLHLKAGTSPDLLVEIHGNTREAACCLCGMVFDMAKTLARVEAGEVDPSCFDCGGPLKANVVMFNEALDMEKLRRARAAAKKCDAMLVVGTSLTVPPINKIVPAAHYRGARLIFVNKASTEMDWMGNALRGEIADILPKIILE